MADRATASHRRSVLVLCGLLTLLAAAAVAGVVVARGSGDDGAEWNGLVGSDPESGEVVVYDETGEEVDRIHAVDGLLSVSARGSHVLASAGDRAAVVDVVAGEVVWEDTIEGVASWLMGTAAPVLAIGDPSGGDLRIVGVTGGTDVRLGEVVDGEPGFASFAGETSPDGTLLAARDTREQRSVIVDLEAGEAREVEGWAAAVTDDAVVLVDRQDGGDATARFVGRDGEERGSAPLGPAPVGMLVTGDDSLLVVSENGDGAVVSTTSVGDDAPTEATALDLTEVGPAQAFPEQGRLVVTGEEGTVVLDQDGEEVAAVDGEVLRVPGATPAAAECFVAMVDDGVAVLDLESGEERARVPFEGVPHAWSSVDGCALGGVGLLVGEDGPVDVDSSAVTAIAPDGAVGLVRGDGRAELVDLADPDGERVEVDRLVSGFVER